MRWQDGPLYFHDGWAHGWPMLVLMVILTAAVVVAVVFLVRYLIRATPPGRAALAAVPAGVAVATTTGPAVVATAGADSPAADETVSRTGDAGGADATIPMVPAGSPQDVLKRRYAAGEIDREEYLQKLQDL